MNDLVTLADRIETFESRDSWLAGRDGVGGSELVRIRERPWQQWHIHVGLLDPPDLSENEAVQAGNRLEKPIMDWLREDADVDFVHTPLTIVRHPSISYRFASPDGLGEGFVVEVKNVGSHRSKDWNEGVPDYYLDQAQGNMDACDMGRCLVGALIGGQRLRYAWVERDDTFIRLQREIVSVFWDAVQAEVCPYQPAADDDGNLLSIYPAEVEKKLVQLPPESLDWSDQLNEVDGRLKALNTAKKELRNRIKAELGDAAYGALPAGQGYWAWKSHDRRGYTVQPNTIRKLTLTKKVT